MSSGQGEDPPPADPIAAAFEAAPAVEMRKSADERAGPAPFTVLGSLKLSYAILMASGEVVDLTPRELNRNNIVGLCGKDGSFWLRQRFPIENKDGEVVGWSVAEASDWIQLKGAQAGHFDISDGYRAGGVWRFEPGARPAADDPRIVVHCGDVLWDGGGKGKRAGKPKWTKPGRWGGHVYGASKPQMRPADEPATIAETAGLLHLLGTWKWRRPAIDPVLLIGQLGAFYVVGALDWRPSGWLVGDRASGKSALQRAFRNLLGNLPLKLRGGTEAFIRQALLHSARPVVFDEIEAQIDNQVIDQVVRLATLASDREGGGVGRGGTGSDSPILYNLDTAFFFSSILRPPIPPAGLQRITLYELGEMKATSDERAVNLARIDALKPLGPRLRRRMIDGWSRFELALAAYHQHLTHAGHSTRAADQLGTLLACAWVLLRDGVPELVDELDEWACWLTAAELRARDDDLADHERCILYLLSCRDGDWNGGARRTVGELVRLASGHTPAGLGYDEQMNLGDMRKRADRDLGRNGLRVLPAEGADPPVLAISNNCEGIRKLYEGSHWGGPPGMTGPWIESLRRLPGAFTRDQRVRFGEVSTRCVLVPLTSLPLGDDDARSVTP